MIEQQDGSKLGWTSAAKRALVLMPEARSGVLGLTPRVANLSGVEVVRR